MSYNPNQPRVPRGSGDTSGEWTSVRDRALSRPLRRHKDALSARRARKQDANWFPGTVGTHFAGVEIPNWFPGTVGTHFAGRKIQR
jgi:hypothetical protein